MHKDIKILLVMLPTGSRKKPFGDSSENGQFQDPPENFELHIMAPPKWSHKLIGDNVVSLSFLLNFILLELFLFAILAFESLNRF